MADADVPILMANGSALQIPPGFHFNPTDEELVMQYLRRRSVSMPLPCAVISDAADVSHRHNPWDVVPEGAEEKFFFARKEAKYLTGRRRTDRATGEGYWKAAGKEVPVNAMLAFPRGEPVLVGMKRRLSLYRGKNPGGERTHWAMHEYRLAGAGLSPFRVATSVSTTTTTIDSLTSPRATAPCACAAAATAKKNAARARARARARAALASARPAAPVMVSPDDSWVLCRISKREGSNLAAGASEVSVPPFIDFLGQADRDASHVSSCLTTTDTSSDKEEGDGATD